MLWLEQRPRLTRLLVVLYASLIFYSSSIPASGIPKTPISTTWLHVVEYSGFGLLLLPAVKSSNNRKHLMLSLLLLSLYAASDEFHQYFVPGRIMDVHDWLADVAGGLLGLFLSKKLLD